ncbi:mitochondrial carrier domain-containing protein [Jimgerdemannia flammicorona]|uniref:Mitochondrial carrier domain-containing protein n=1 Tax=Jimgerdemannia flammicorona TaxID=994334 RepID=A0A433QUE5_9FUNG|nr:mitochondrial carrier domain-containing protein [Jimgerdemannia flammicorona]
MPLHLSLSRRFQPVETCFVTKSKKNPAFSLIAGATAGGVEGAMTYPTEYIKTRLQLEGGKLAAGQAPRFKGPIDLLMHTVRTQGIFAIYRGITKLIHDQNTPNPKYRGLIHGVTTIVRAEGLGGIYRGLFPVMMRQDDAF